MAEFPQTWNLMSSFSTFFQYTQCHTELKVAVSQPKKIRGMRYQNHWISGTKKTTRKWNNLREEHDYSHWWNRAQSCHLCVSRTNAVRSEKEENLTLKKVLWKKKKIMKTYMNTIITESSHPWPRYQQLHRSKHNCWDGHINKYNCKSITILVT